MAITTAERTQIVEMTVLMFNAAPGEVYLAQIVALYEANPGTSAQKLQALANQLATTSVYTSMHPNFETAEEFAADFLTPLGLQNDAVAKDFIIAKVNAGVSKGQIAYEAYVALNAVPSTGAAQYVAANAILNNKTTVAEFYSTSGGVATDLATLQSVITSVTADPATVQPAKDAITQGGSFGQTFTLTTNQDTLTGTAGGDAFNAGVAVLQGGGVVDTLQAFDQINGGDGSDTLNVTLNTAAAVTPTLTAVETVNLRATGAATLNLSASTGVTAVNVDASTAVATLTSIGGASVGVLNQKQNVNINGSTATGLALNLSDVGTAATDIVVDLGSATANAATSFAITANHAHVTFIETTGSAATTSATIAGTGSNEITFAAADLASLTSVTTSGAGSVDLRAGALAAVKTLTAGDGGLKATVTNATAGAVTATTGGGADTLSLVGAGVKAVSTGAGKDSVSVNTSNLSATSTVDLGAGDDSLTFATAGFQFATGATLTGGDGTDTIGMTKADYDAISLYTTANLAKVTGFEVLSISNALVTGDLLDVSKIAGIVSFTAAAGVTAANTATASNLGAASTVTLAGAAANSGTLTATLKTDTSADAMTLVVNKDFTDNNDTASTASAATSAFTAADVETLTVNSTGKNTSLPFTAVDGYKADTITNTLTLTGSNKLTGVTVTGDQKLILASTAAMTKLATVDASANKGGLTFDGSLADMTTATSSVAMTITGSATAANSVIGTGRADTIVGGAKGDTLVGGAGADTLTGGAGNDIFAYSVAADSTLVNLDTIADFSANTFGNGTAGAAGTGAGAVASRTGDVIQLDVGAAQLAVGVKVGVQANASDAQTFLQNVAADVTINEVGVALDSSSGRLYIDWDSNGTADSVIQLTGATTITAAAFVLV